MSVRSNCSIATQAFSLPHSSKFIRFAFAEFSERYFVGDTNARMITRNVIRAAAALHS